MGRALAGPTRPWAGDPDSVQQQLQLGALMPLASGDQHGQRPAAAVAGQMQLGGQPTPATAQRLIGLGTRP
jgi:hypothetical protein